MSRQSRGISLRDKVETFHLSFTLDEFKKGMEGPHQGIHSNNKTLWLKDEGRPEVIHQMDLQIRKYFSMKEDNRSVICCHHPPAKGGDGKFLEKTLKIKENNPKVISRVIVSTTHDICDVSFGSSHPDTIEFKSWVATKIPDMIGGMLSYTFKNEKNITIPARKGFRQVRKTKNIDDRYLIVFDYLVSEREIEELSNMFKTKDSVANVMDDPKIADAMRELS